jgi:hypothetical protein
LRAHHIAIAGTARSVTPAASPHRGEHLRARKSGDALALGQDVAAVAMLGAVILVVLGTACILLRDGDL